MRATAAAAPAPPVDLSGLRRLNYIGSKLRLIPWIFSVIRAQTGFATLRGKHVVDAFAGTGVVSYALRQEGAVVTCNDAENYSAVISHALAKSAYSEHCRSLIARLNAELSAGAHMAGAPGFMARNYSPDGSDRTFFTVDNARRADYVRRRLEEERPKTLPDDYTFLLASLLVCADRVANVAAVYACYLKRFKPSARRPLVIEPIHQNTLPGSSATRSFNCDATTAVFLARTDGDVAYVDPPYNGRQYSKNYFPLAILAKTPAELTAEPPLKGLTGIPETCFLSSLCRKRNALESMRRMLSGLRCPWVFVSYSTEGIIPEGDMMAMMREHGEVTVVRQDYKRFKSYNYNVDRQVQELLYCLRKRAPQ